MRRHLAVIILIEMATLRSLSFSVQAEVVNTTADLGNSKKIVAYVYSHAMLEAMYNFGVAQDRKFGLQTGCKTDYSVNPVRMLLLFRLRES